MAQNGFNFHFTWMKFIVDAIEYYFQGHYTHCGVVVVIDQRPYLFHLTDDVFKNQMQSPPRNVTCVPSLCTMDNLTSYHGFAYHYAYTGDVQVPNEKVNGLVADIGKSNIVLQGNCFITMLVNGAGLGRHTGNKMVCTDFSNLILSKLGILEDGPKTGSNLKTIMNMINRSGKYDTRPMRIETAWSLYRQI
jgi:hypothetical protein